MAANHSSASNTFVFDPSGLLKIGHSLLGKRCTDNIPRQVFHGGFITGKNPLPDKDVETGVPPFFHQRDQVPAYLSFFQKHLQHVVTKQHFQRFGIHGRRNGKHAAFVEAPVRNQNMQVWIIPQKVTECLDGNGRSGDSRLFPDTSRVYSLQRVPSTTAQLRKQLAVVQKIASDFFRNTEHHMPVNNSLDHLRAKPLAEFHAPFLVAGWAKMPPFA